MDVKIFVLSPNPNPKTLDFRGLNIHRSRSYFEIASCDFGGPDSLLQFNALVSWADVVHFHFPWPFGDLLQYFARIKKPYIITYHSDILRQKFGLKLYKPLMMSTLSGAQAIVATSPAYAKTSPILSVSTLKSVVSLLAFQIMGSPQKAPKKEKVAHLEAN